MEIGGKVRNFESMTKGKVIRNLADKTENLFLTREILKFLFTDSENFSEIRGKFETRGNASLAQGDGRPWNCVWY